MDKGKFTEAKNFIFADIEREIELAKSGKDAGNFICALALLCYTEFMGGVKRGRFQQGEARRNFISFFDDLGKDYAEVAKTFNVYSIFRCGLTHEYFVKEDCTIYMLGDKKPGLGKDDDGYYFVVEQYYADFKKAVESLEKVLFS